jgi:hypothetical protein
MAEPLHRSDHVRVDAHSSRTLTAVLIEDSLISCLWWESRRMLCWPRWSPRAPLFSFRPPPSGGVREVSSPVA